MDAKTVRSADGTEIAYVALGGDGPPLLLVHGAMSDHTRFAPLVPHLTPHRTVYAMDRRGRGASGDGADYAVEREYEDVAVVVDDIAAARGSSVDVYGHSHGAFVVYGAAALTDNLGRVVLYEGWPMTDPSAISMPGDLGPRVDAMVASGDREGALVAVLRELLSLDDETIDAVRSQPSWAARMAAVHTVGREVDAEASVTFDPAVAARIAVPVLLVTGAETTDPSGRDTDRLAAALPDATIAVLEGQGHVADGLAPDVFAEPVIRFLTS